MGKGKSTKGQTKICKTYI